MEASQREDVARADFVRLRGPYAEGLEPTLESCMKIQRRTGVNGFEKGAIAPIRVVPPSLRSLLGLEGSFYVKTKKEK